MTDFCRTSCFTNGKCTFEIMNRNYKILLNEALHGTKETNRLFRWIRKSQPSDLDYVTNQLHDLAFENINCLECANCCTTTGPLFLNKDIDRLARHFKMRPSEFTEKYLTTDDDSDFVFKNMPCPFLKDKYCSVYESRPNACREYPHTQQRQILRKLAITEKNALICPAVSKVVEGLKKHYKWK